MSDDDGIIPIGGPDGKSCALLLLGALAGLGALVAGLAQWFA